MKVGHLTKKGQTNGKVENPQKDHMEREKEIDGVKRVADGGGVRKVDIGNGLDNIRARRENGADGVKRMGEGVGRMGGKVF